MKLIGLTNDNTALFWTGKGYVGFELITQWEIDERNDPENLRDTYDYLWKEAVADGLTEEGLIEYLIKLIESETVYGNKYFFGQDDSYIYKIEKENFQWLNDNSGLDSELVTFHCVLCCHAIDDLKIVKRPDVDPEPKLPKDKLDEALARTKEKLTKLNNVLAEIKINAKSGPESVKLVHTVELSRVERLRHRLGSATRSKTLLRVVK